MPVVRPPLDDLVVVAENPDRSTGRALVSDRGYPVVRATQR